MSGADIIKRFVVSIILELKKRGILTDVLQSSRIPPAEWIFIKELFQPFEEESE